MKSQVLATVPLSNGHPARRRAPGRVALAVAALPMFIALGGCAAATEESIGPQTCAEIVETAAFEQEVEDEVKLFDRAIEECESYEEISREMHRWELPGYTVERFLEKRCTDEAETLGGTDVCAIAAPPTTLPEVVENPEYKGKTLDGKLITVTPAEVEFNGPIPVTIEETVGLASEGCVTVLGVRDDFAHYVNDSRKGQIASMYAQHAESVAAFIGCTIPPVVIGPSGPNVTVPPPTTVAG